MSIPSHGVFCETFGFPTRCKQCHIAVIYVSCNHGSRFFLEPESGEDHGMCCSGRSERISALTDRVARENREYLGRIIDRLRGTQLQPKPWVRLNGREARALVKTHNRRNHYNATERSIAREQYFLSLRAFNLCDRCQKALSATSEVGEHFRVIMESSGKPLMNYDQAEGETVRYQLFAFSESSETYCNCP